MPKKSSKKRSKTVTYVAEELSDDEMSRVLGGTDIYKQPDDEWTLPGSENTENTSEPDVNLGLSENPLPDETRFAKLQLNHF